MSLVDSFRNFFMPPEDDDLDVDVPSSESTSSDDPTSATATRSTSSSSSTSSYAPRRTTSYSSSYDDAASRKGDRSTTIKATAQFQVVLVKATTYAADSKKVADYLMDDRTVVLNLEDISDAEKRRIIDFVVGAAYAMHGRIRPIANQTFLIIPKNVVFDGDDIVGELQGSGLV